MSATIWRKMNGRRDHRWAQSRYSEYVDGELPEREQRRLAAHEDLCPDCGRVARTLRRMLVLLPGMREAYSQQLAERTAQAVAERIDQDPSSGEPSGK